MASSSFTNAPISIGRTSTTVGGCVAITAAQAALRSFAYAITSARNEGDPQNPWPDHDARPPQRANVNAAAVGIDCL
jgi:hypothetical protein